MTDYGVKQLQAYQSYIRNLQQIDFPSNQQMHAIKLTVTSGMVLDDIHNSIQPSLTAEELFGRESYEV